MVADHLLRVEQGVLAVLRDGTPVRKRRLADLPRYALVWLVLTRGIRVRVPVRGVTPDADVDVAAVRAGWEAARDGLREWLAGLDRAALRRPVFRHPIAGPMNPEQTLLFLRRHWDHHLRQIRRIRGAPGFPG